MKDLRDLKDLTILRVTQPLAGKNLLVTLMVNSSGRVAAHNPIGFYRHNMLPPPPERRPHRSMRFPGSVLSTRSLAS